MPLTIDELREEFRALTPEQRRNIFNSVSDPEEEEIVPLGLHPAWRAEIAQRLQDYRDGKMEAIPWEEVEREMDGLVDRPLN